MRYASGVPIDLSHIKPGDSSAIAAPSALRERLAELQLAQIVHKRRAIVLLEGWEASGRRPAIRQLAGVWDPCHYTTHCVTADDPDRDRHWLARFWANLPGAGSTALFHGSWYRQVADERLLARLSDKAWARRCDEINEFEAQQRDHGTLIVKLFFQVSAEAQAERIARRDADPWRRHLVAPERRAMPPRDIQQEVWNDLLSHTDTRWAPWALIDASGDGATEAALGAIAAAFEKAIPLDPPAENDQTVVMLNQHKAG
jgi:polyphosphate kinase 2 (PPK2 family)